MQRPDTKNSSHCQIEPLRLPPRGANVADGTEDGTKDGSLPLRTQALTTLGISWKPDSSAKTIWGPTAQPSFKIWTVFFHPVIDLCFIPLQRTPFWLLGAPSQAVHQAPDMVPVVAHTKLALDHLGNARRGPQIGPVILRHRSLEQQADQTRFLSATTSFKGRPGEKRTCNASRPPCRRASRQRITELGLHPICHPTWLRDNPSSSSAKARLRRSSRRSALPFSLGIRVPNLNIYCCIVYAVDNSLSERNARGGLAQRLLRHFRSVTHK
jgi:hypothetical protein